MKSRLKELAKTARQELDAYRFALNDPRTPRLAKLLFWLAIGYLLLPFDVIPDFIPVLGQLDDLIIIPLLLAAAIKLTPKLVLRECRARALATSHI